MARDVVFKIMVLLHFWFSCARHCSWDVVWVCAVSSVSYPRMAKELSEIIADRKFNKTLLKLSTEYLI
jgi:hypothetical protein